MGGAETVRYIFPWDCRNCVRIFVSACLRGLLETGGRMPFGSSAGLCTALRIPSLVPASRFKRFLAKSFRNVLPTPLSPIDCHLRDGVA